MSVPDKERILTLLAYLKKSASELSKELGYINGSRFYHISSGRNKISYTLAREITDKYPNVNFQWLRHGIGSIEDSNEKPKVVPVKNLDSINMRIAHLVEETLKTTPYNFSKSIGNQRHDVIYNILNNKNKPSNKILEKIFSKYPEYKSWILLGKKTEVEEYIAAFKEQILNLENEVKRLKQEVVVLKNKTK